MYVSRVMVCGCSHGVAIRRLLSGTEATNHHASWAVPVECQTQGQTCQFSKTGDLKLISLAFVIAPLRFLIGSNFMLQLEC
jgi:hypothetical protein